jgi:hypothetical protein
MLNSLFFGYSEIASVGGSYGCDQAQQAQAIAHVTGSSSRLEVVCFLPLYCIAQLTGRPHTAILLLSRLFFHDLSLFQKLFGPNAGREAYASLLME